MRSGWWNGQEILFKMLLDKKRNWRITHHAVTLRLCISISAPVHQPFSPLVLASGK